jgi:ubiquitin-like modifier-activating enzyme ATG7
MFADIKKYQFLHWCATPALHLKQPATIKSKTKLSSVFEEARLQLLLNQIKNVSTAFFLVDRKSGDVSDISLLKNQKTFPADLIVGFMDSSAREDAVGWPLRNMLRLLKYQFNLSDVSVLCFRHEKSFIIDLGLSENNDKDQPSASGWEKNDLDKLGPRKTNLGNSMNPVT